MTYRIDTQVMGCWLPLAGRYTSRAAALAAARDHGPMGEANNLEGLVWRIARLAPEATGGTPRA